MAYEKVKLVYAMMSGDIYMARVNNGIMDTTNRRVATQDVLRASTEWFIGNDKQMIQYEGDETGKPTLFYTKDTDKIEQIKAILLEDDADEPKDV